MTENNQNAPEITKTYAVDVERVGLTHYRAANPQGASVDFGSGEGLMTPVELLLAAIAGCSAVDVDVVTSRRSEPQAFDVHVEGDRINEDGASRLSDVRVSFNVSFPDDEAGRKAQSMVERLVEISKTKDCTVSRTVEHEANVDFTVN